MNDIFRLKIVILGLSITSSWGNGHATTYRGLVRALSQRGHNVLFLERDVSWYASNRDLAQPPYGETALYNSLDALRDTYAPAVREADLVIVGSYVPEGVAISEWVTETATGVKAFYDIDTPVTLAKLRRVDYEYIAPHVIPRFDLYLSFTGGPLLRHIERQYGVPLARPLYCAFDPELYYPETRPARWDLGYMGTYSDDRQPTLDNLLLQAARLDSRLQFVVVGPQYPSTIVWPSNVQRVEHLPPAQHRAFYTSQRFTLNITRSDMLKAGYSPSVRLFEAAACGVPIISDYWVGLEAFFEIGSEILIARSHNDILRDLQSMPEERRLQIAQRARARVLAQHTAAHRAMQLENHFQDALSAHASAAL